MMQSANQIQIHKHSEVEIKNKVKITLNPIWAVALWAWSRGAGGECHQRPVSPVPCQLPAPGWPNSIRPSLNRLPCFPFLCSHIVDIYTPGRHFIWEYTFLNFDNTIRYKVQIITSQYLFHHHQLLRVERTWGLQF